jgi:hypothetical protein
VVGEKQEDIWIAHTELAVAPGHPFYKRLNELREGAGFDEFVEGLCARFYNIMCDSGGPRCGAGVSPLCRPSIERSAHLPLSEMHEALPAQCQAFTRSRQASQCPCGGPV